MTKLSRGRLIPIPGFLPPGYSSLSYVFPRFLPPAEILKSGAGTTFWVPRLLHEAEENRDHREAQATIIIIIIIIIFIIHHAINTILFVPLFIIPLLLLFIIATNMKAMYMLF